MWVSSAEKHGSSSSAVEGHGMKRASSRTDVLDLSPAVAIPLPGVTERGVRKRVPAEEHDASPRCVVGHRMTNTGPGTHVLLLRPKHLRHIASPREVDERSGAIDYAELPHANPLRCRCRRTDMSNPRESPTSVCRFASPESGAARVSALGRFGTGSRDSTCDRTLGTSADEHEGTLRCPARGDCQGESHRAVQDVARFSQTSQRRETT